MAARDGRTLRAFNWLRWTPIKRSGNTVTIDSSAGLPETGWDTSAVETRLRALNSDPIRHHFGNAFRATPEIEAFGKRMLLEFSSQNGIFAQRLPWMRDHEQELLRMYAGLLGGDKNVVGTFTSGGSESVYSAILAMREWAKKHRPVTGTPNIVVPYSAHPTFSKGCDFFQLEIRRIPVAADSRADVVAMEAAIDANTVGLCGAAPCWPFGVIDPIESLAEVARRHDVWMHVDACVGGYLAPFVERLGHTLPAWDFRVPGVHSISADLHKYGYCPKPASTIFYRDAERRECAQSHPKDWPGGEYNTGGFAGSRPQGAVFASWATMMHLGNAGYLAMTQRVLDSMQRLRDALNAIDGLQVLDCDLPPLPVSGTTLDIGKVSAALMLRGWIMLGSQNPKLLNLPVDAAFNDQVFYTFIADVTEVCDDLRSGRSDIASNLSYG